MGGLTADSPWWLILELLRAQQHNATLIHCHTIPRPPPPSPGAIHLHLKVRPTGLAHDHASQTRTKSVDVPPDIIRFSLILFHINYS